MQRLSRPARRRLSVAPWIALWLVLCAASAGWAQVRLGDIGMQVELAGPPRIRPNQPAALYVTLTNNGPPLDDGRLQIEILDYAQRVRARVEQPVSLPSGAHKRYAMLLPSFYGYSPSNAPIPLKLLDANGRVIAEAVKGTNAPTTVSDNDPTVLMVSPNKADFSYLTTYKNAFGTSPNSATIFVDGVAPNVVPAQWSGLASCDFVILEDAQSMQFTPEQQRALLDYVSQGGNLVLISNGDANQFNNSGLTEALPAKPVASVSLHRISGVKAAERAQFAAPDPLLLDMRPPADATVLARCGAVPLLVARPWGLGTVYLCGVDLGNTHTLTDAGLKALWTTLLSHFHAQRKDLLGVSIDDALAFPPELTPPSVSFLALFMLAYIALVGPLNYLVLRRRDRMLWTWVTVPAIAIGFTVLSFMISYQSKGSALVVREFTVLKLRQGSTTAFGHSFVSLFSPRRAAYDVRWPGRTLPRPEMGDEGPALTMGSDEGAVVRQLDIAMWSMRRVHAEGVRDLPGAIRMNIKRAGDRLSGEIVNDSGLELANSVLVLDDRACIVHLQAGRNVIDESATPIGPESLASMLARIAPADRRGLQSTVARANEAVSQALGHRKTPTLLAWPATPLVEAQVTPAPPAVDSANLLVVF